MDLIDRFGFRVLVSIMAALGGLLASAGVVRGLSQCGSLGNPACGFGYPTWGGLVYLAVPAAAALLSWRLTRPIMHRRDPTTARRQVSSTLIRGGRLFGALALLAFLGVTGAVIVAAGACVDECHGFGIAWLAGAYVGSAGGLALIAIQDLRTRGRVRAGVRVMGWLMLGLSIFAAGVSFLSVMFEPRLWRLYALLVGGPFVAGVVVFYLVRRLAISGGGHFSGNTRLRDHR